MNKQAIDAVSWLKQHRAAAVMGAIVVIIAIAGISSSTRNDSATNYGVDNTDSAKVSTDRQTEEVIEQPKVREPEGTEVTLATGTFEGGRDVAVGLYDVTTGAGQSGNFIVNGVNQYNEILGSGNVSKIRVRISKDDKIQISSLSSVAFTPVEAEFVVDHVAVDLYAGTFIVGEDVGVGRYTVVPGAGENGNFIVGGSSYYNEILGSDANYGGVPSITVSLRAGDKVTISSMNQVSLTPLD